MTNPLNTESLEYLIKFIASVGMLIAGGWFFGIAWNWYYERWGGERDWSDSLHDNEYQRIFNIILITINIFQNMMNLN